MWQKQLLKEGDPLVHAWAGITDRSLLTYQRLPLLR